MACQYRYEVATGESLPSVQRSQADIRTFILCWTLECAHSILDPLSRYILFLFSQHLFLANARASDAICHSIYEESQQIRCGKTQMNILYCLFFFSFLHSCDYSFSLSTFIDAKRMRSHWVVRLLTIHLPFVAPIPNRWQNINKILNRTLYIHLKGQSKSIECVCRLSAFITAQGTAKISFGNTVIGLCRWRRRRRRL